MADSPGTEAASQRPPYNPLINMSNSKPVMVDE